MQVSLFFRVGLFSDFNTKKNHISSKLPWERAFDNKRKDFYWTLLLLRPMKDFSSRRFFFSLLWGDQLEYIADPFHPLPILRVMLRIWPQLSSQQLQLHILSRLMCFMKGSILKLYFLIHDKVGEKKLKK